MPLSELAAGLSGLAVVAGGLSAFFAVRTQRDMAKLKIEILEAINGKYISRKEAEIVLRERRRWETSAAEEIKDQREAFEALREEFVSCRAAHREASR